MEEVTIIATSKDEAVRMTETAKCDFEVRGTEVFDVPVPKIGSYFNPFPHMPWVRMSTPEFMWLRKSNELSEQEAYRLLDALLTGGEYEPVGMKAKSDGSHTTLQKLLDYLFQVKETPAGRRAILLIYKYVSMTS